jgi:Mn2+/Fe2+ NRAMP family transporter
MTSKKPSKMAIVAGKCLAKAVREELQRKALLGQYVIIERNGKACRISAKQALKIAKSK